MSHVMPPHCQWLLAIALGTTAQVMPLAALAAPPIEAPAEARATPVRGLILRLHSDSARAGTVSKTAAPRGPQRIELPQPLPLQEAKALAAHLRQDPQVQDVVLDVQERLAAVPNDTLYAGSQWWLGPYNAATSPAVADLPAAWDRSTGTPVSGTGPVVAVLDSGITGHPDLDAHVLPGYDFVSQVDYANDGNGRDNDPRDPGDRLTSAERDANLGLWDGCAVRDRSTWHGTMIAGQLGAISNNGAGVAGINWNAQVLPVRVAGRCGASIADLVDGLRWAAGLAVPGVPPNPTPARLIVLGVAGVQACNVNDPDPDLAAAARLYVDTLAEVRAQGAVVFAAAGNQRSAVGRPAACTGAFAVASLNRQGFKSFYSNYGPQVALATVGGDENRGATGDALLADPGIVSTSNDGIAAQGNFAYASGSGTSFAAPAAAGVASLMLALNPGLTVEQIETGLKQSVRPHVKVPALGACAASGNFSRCECTTATCGAGILDATQALAYAAVPLAYQPPARTAVSLDSPAIREYAALLGLPPLPDAGGSPDPTPSTGGGGGGAMPPLWLAGLLLAVGLAARTARDE